MVTKHKMEGLQRRARHAPLLRVEEEPVMSWPLPTDAGGYTLFGRSRAAAGTGFFIPELSWAFDAGVVAHNARPEHVFISHTHADHIQELIHMKSRHKPPHFYVPAHAVDLVEDFLTSAMMLNNSTFETPEERALWRHSYTIHGVEPGDRIEIKRGGATFVVDVVACDHSVPCLGYVVSDLRNKLKPEFASLSGPEIGQLRRDGVEVAAPVSRPLFAYLGDTTNEVFRRHPEILASPVVITECSFLDDVGDRAAMTKHSSWLDLAPLIEEHPETLFILIHFSLRYKPHEVHDFFEALDAEAEASGSHSWDNIMLWLPS